MEYKELLQKRRSIRSFQDRRVPLETIQEIISESCLAPNGGNRQEWRFVIVNKREMIRRISDESKGNLLKEMQSAPDASANRYLERLKDKEFNVFYNAPCLVLILGPQANHGTAVDCALVAAYFMLSAAERGLGTCWIGLGSVVNDPDLRNELGIAPDLQLVAPIIVGYPAQIPSAPERKAPLILKLIE